MAQQTQANDYSNQQINLDEIVQRVRNIDLKMTKILQILEKNEHINKLKFQQEFKVHAEEIDWTKLVVPSSDFQESKESSLQSVIQSSEFQQSEESTSQNRKQSSIQTSESSSRKQSSIQTSQSKVVPSKSIRNRDYSPAYITPGADPIYNCNQKKFTYRTQQQDLDYSSEEC